MTDDICPNCGGIDFYQNSSGNMECDNCGYSEEDEEQSDA